MKKSNYEIVIVGAGAAGVGIGVLLKLLGIENFVILERYEVGASFEKWPGEMKFISPSFPGHDFNHLDLNAVVPNTSPGDLLNKEHPNGREYKRYLEHTASYFELPVRCGIDVKKVSQRQKGKYRFSLETDSEEIKSSFLIWAAGEFQYPNFESFKGAEYCIHNSQVTSWSNLAGNEFIVIGGFESGMDAAINLVNLGKKVLLFDSNEAWKAESNDPSCKLSPFTRKRLSDLVNNQNLIMKGNSNISEVKKTDDGFFVKNGKCNFFTSNKPILANGFQTSLVMVKDLFEWNEFKNFPVLTENDESTITPGLFLVGPNVRHEDLIFCFIYKFRQRFGVVAREICKRMNYKDLNSEVFDFYRDKGMLLDDLSCCGDECTC